MGSGRMATGTETKFATSGPMWVPPNALTAVPLSPTAGGSDHVTSTGEGIVFREDVCREHVIGERGR